MRRLLVATALSATLTAACGDTSSPVGRGDLLISVAANEAVRVGFPHEEGGQQLAFVDGWSVEFETFAVSINQLDLTEATPDGDGASIASWSEAVIVDMASSETGEVELTTLVDVEEGRHDFGFRVAPPSADASGADAQTVARMRDNGWSVLIRGTATPDEGHPEFDTPIQFDFGFSLEAEYFNCINGADGTQGAVVAANRQNEAYIYPHVVHIFWDTLGAGNEQLRFDPMARVAGDDDVVVLEELDEVDLTDSSLTNEAGVPLYDDAGLLDTYTLGAFVRRAIAESFHFNGIGFCKKRILN